MQLKKYQFKDYDFEMDINVSIEERTIYMNQKELIYFFDVAQSTISKRLNSILKSRLNSSLDIPKTEYIFHDDIKYYPLEIIKEIGEKYNKERIEKLEKWLEEIINKNLPVLLEDNYKIVRYSRDNLKLDVKIDVKNRTAWLSQDDIAVLFDVTVSTISRHINNIYEDEELDRTSTLAFFAIVQIEGDREIKRNVEYYNTDMLVAIGYRVNSKNAIIFRKWVSSIVNGFIANGYAIDENRFAVLENSNNLIFGKINILEDKIEESNHRIKDLENKVSIFDIPKEIVFDQGQFCSSYEYLIKIIESATSTIDIVDNYADHHLLSILKYKKSGVQVKLLMSSFAKLSDDEVDAYNKEYGDLSISRNSVFHDRYFVIDKSIGYHIGPSVNHMGKSVSSAMKMVDKICVDFVIEKINECFLNTQQTA